MRKNETLGVFLISILAWVATFWLALRIGVAHDVTPEILYGLRLPRAILATAIGMGLAVGGAGLQALFTNPLCEPYTLGISSGAALGAVIGLSLGVDGIFGGIAGPAFLGALLVTAILYLIALRPDTSSSTLLLTGIMLGFLGTSLVSLWLSLSSSTGLQGALAWLFGDLSRARFKGAVFLLAVVSFLSWMIWTHWRALDAFLMGEESAQALGVDVAQNRRKIILLISLLIGFCVGAGGMIGFVGLVVPHFCRRMVGALHIRLLPLSAIWGATLLVVADWLSRVLASPYELPVGIVTALVGAPLFLWMMLRRGEQR